MIPTDHKARNRLPTHVAPVLLQEGEFRARQAQCRTNIVLAIDLVREAMRCQEPYSMGVLDAWSWAEELVQVLARRRKDWISLLKKNRLLAPARVHLRSATAGPCRYRNRRARLRTACR